MKKSTLFIYLTLVIINSCSNFNKEKNIAPDGKLTEDTLYTYSNNHYNLFIIKNDLDSIKFSLVNLQKKSTVNGFAQLIKENGEIPEGTNRIDYNDPDDIIGFKCDSTYFSCSKNFCLYFAMEAITKKRLDFGIHNSADSVFTECSYTLLLE